MSELIMVITVAVSSWLMTNYLQSDRSKINILDHPNERSMHENPTPRSGGIAVFLSLLLGGCWLYLLHEDQEIFLLILISSVMFSLSLVDDYRNLSVLSRLLVHLGLAASMLYFGHLPDALELPGFRYSLPAAIAYTVFILFIVWSINLYNFMDGMDGFSSGMALIGFAALGIIAYQADEISYFWCCVIIVAAVSGFLFFNYPPASIFMGDSGSSLLGLLMAWMTLWGNQLGIISIWLSILIFSPFILDATVTLIRRILNREKIWLAHRTHYYQRLATLRFGVKKTLWFEYVLMFLVAITAVFISRQSDFVQTIALFVWTGMYLTIVSYIELNPLLRIPK